MYPDDIQTAIKAEAAKRRVSTETVEGWLEQHTSQFNFPITSWGVGHAAEYNDPNDPHVMVKSASHTLNRIAATYWARAAGAYVPEAIDYFDSMEKWDATEFAKRYPITLPTDDEGMIDSLKLTNATFAGNLQRALMFDTQAAIAEASVWGGDDNWYDYLPNGMLQLVSLQGEEWAVVWADIWNTHPYGDDRYYSDEIEEDEQERLDNIEEALAERWGFFLQDVTSGFVVSLMRKHNN